MFWEINISRHGYHYFATHKRSLLDSDKAIAVFDDLIQRFPSSEGFHISMSRHESSNWVCDFTHLDEMRARRRGA